VAMTGVRTIGRKHASKHFLRLAAIPACQISISSSINGRMLLSDLLFNTAILLKDALCFEQQDGVNDSPALKQVGNFIRETFTMPDMCSLNNCGQC